MMMIYIQQHTELKLILFKNINIQVFRTKQQVDWVGEGVKEERRTLRPEKMLVTINSLFFSFNVVNSNKHGQVKK